MKLKIGAHYLNISEGNVKMGGIPSLSTRAVLTCHKGVPCTRDCYALRMEKLRPSVRNAYQENMDCILNEPHEDIVREITRYLQRINAKFFRLNVSGDFNLQGYFPLAIRICNANPSVKFLAFTKCRELVKKDIPENFSLVFSCWGEYRIRHIPHTEYRSAWFNDGKHYVASYAKECDGHCEGCFKCFNMKKGEAVFFNKH